MFETPILFLIFNRPDTTKVVFNRIKEFKPKYLFVVADIVLLIHLQTICA